MADSPTTERSEPPSNGKFARGLARAFAGAILFSFPLLMTMEMWWLGFYLDRSRLLLFLVLNLALLVPLSRFVGFEDTQTLTEDVLDAFAAYGVAILASALMLTIFGVLTPDMPTNEILGKIAIQSVPASIGASIARDQLGAHYRDREKEEGNSHHPYAHELFLMMVGALFLAFNVAPTEEMIVIAFKMTAWHALILVALSIFLLHAFVYAVDFRGAETMPQGTGIVSGVIAYSVAGYGIAILVSLYVLWTFGRTDGASLSEVAMMIAVLGFPASLGAGAARLIV